MWLSNYDFTVLVSLFVLSQGRSTVMLDSFKANVPNQIETIQLISTVNQMTGLCMVEKWP